MNHIYRYKFVPFDDGTIKIITDGTIKFSSPILFNDPFDCYPHFPHNHADIEDYIKKRPDLFKKAAEVNGFGPAQRLQRKGELIANLQRSLKNGQYRKSLLENVSVVCLSRSGSHQLMWAHYADSHKGFAVEFRIPTHGTLAEAKKSEDYLLPLEVKYQATRPRVRLTEKTTTQSINDILLTKSAAWNYEEEERVISFTRPEGIYPYDRSRVLCSVIAGAMMSNPHRTKLRQAVLETNEKFGLSIDFHEAKLAPETYEIHVPSHPRIGSPKA